MSETPHDQEHARGFDDGLDPDGDPDNLNPREGAKATGDARTSDVTGPENDPDGDPDMLNPRHGSEASSE